jgi:DNA invertase Pin-like site-specific DNA recombinase
MIETGAPDVEGGRMELGPGAFQQRPSVPAAGILIGYARCSTEKQDLTVQREILRDLGVAEERVYLDHGLTGTNRSRPGLNSALAALREGDTLVVPKLDRLARSVPDARAIGDSLAARGVRLSLGGSVYDPSDPMGKCFFNILATFAEFEVDLLRMRTREGMARQRPTQRQSTQAQPHPACGPAQAPRGRGTLDR